MRTLRGAWAGLLVLAIATGAAWTAPAAARRAAALPPPSSQLPGKQPGTGGQPEGSGAEMRIAAVVNDEVISVFDLLSRMRMVMISSNIQDTPETRQRIFSQVLRSLIDERLEAQEGKRRNITASDDEVNRALQQIETQNNMRPGQLDDFLKARGLEKSALVDQITTSIIWAKLVRRQASQTMEITDEEIDDAMRRLKEHANEPQSRVAEIFLAVDNPSQDEEVRRLAERLSDQMKKGARFSAVAQQFSQSATAAVGGDLGWLRPDQLPAELAKTVSKLRPGELSQPIRMGGGYYLMLVLDRRTGNTGSEQDQVYDIVQVVFPLGPQAGDAQKRAALAQLEEVRSAAKDCPTMLKIGKEKAPQLSSQGQLRAATISPEMRGVISKLAIGQVSQPIMQRNGIGAIMVCSKSNPGSGPASREEVAETLLRQRLDTVSRRYLSELRRASYVDVRV